MLQPHRAYDHVGGADIRDRPDWNMPYSHTSRLHEPLCLFTILTCCTDRIGLSAGVVVLPQRQTVLFGKPAPTSPC